MLVPTVSEILNKEPSYQKPCISEADVAARCPCCGCVAPLSAARRITKNDNLFYRCGTCEEALLMIAPEPKGMIACASIYRSGEWAIHPIADLTLSGALLQQVAGNG